MSHYAAAGNKYDRAKRLLRDYADGLITKAEIHRLLESCQQQGAHYSDALIAHVAEVYGRRCEMSEVSVHEPGPRWLTPQDVDRDVRALSEALLEQRAERIARNVLSRPDIQEVIRQLLATKLYSNEEDIIVRSLRAMQVAVAP